MAERERITIDFDRTDLMVELGEHLYQAQRVHDPAMRDAVVALLSGKEITLTVDGEDCGTWYPTVDDAVLPKAPHAE